MTQESQSTIDFSKLEHWEMKPWKRVGLTQEQWSKPMSELSEEHRKLIFEVFNAEFKVNFTPEFFGITKKK